MSRVTTVVFASSLLAILTAGMLAVAAPADAATASRASPFAGHWEAEVKGDGHAFSFDFDFEVRGDTLGGDVSLSTRDDLFPIRRGRISGHRISFQSFGLWTGDLVGEDLKLVRELDGGKKQSMVAHRRAKS